MRWGEGGKDSFLGKRKERDPLSGISKKERIFPSFSFY